MVQQFQDEPGEDEELELSAEEEAAAEEAAAEDEAETEEPAPEVDVAALKAELDTLRASAASRSDLERIARETGQIRALQGALDRLQGQNPLAALDPRLNASEGLLGTLAEALLGSDLISDTQRAQLQQAIAAYNQNGNVRARQQLRQEILSELQQQQPPPPQQQPANAQTELEVYIAAEALKAYAAGKGVEWGSIPPADLQVRPGESVAQARQRVEGVITGLAQEDESTGRVQARRRGAGSGSPKRSGAAGNIDDLIESYGSGQDLPLESYQRLEKSILADIEY